MNFFNHLFTLVTTTATEQSVSNEQFLWLVLSGLFLVIIFAVVVVVASTASAAAAAVADEDSADM